MKNIKQIIDPAFLRDSNYSYVNYNNDELCSVLCFAIAKNHCDLILHQQRIEVLSGADNNILLFTAIVDLFTTLEDKGGAYKKRILHKYKKFLTTKQMTVLTQSISSKITPFQVIPNLSETILNKGQIGETLSMNHLSINNLMKQS